NQQKPNTGLRARLDAWRAPAARADPLRDRACVRKPRATVPAIKQILIYRLSAKETDGLKARRSTAAVGATARLRGRHTRCLNSAETAILGLSMPVALPAISHRPDRRLTWGRTGRDSGPL